MANLMWWFGKYCHKWPSAPACRYGNANNAALALLSLDPQKLERLFLPTTTLTGGLAPTPVLDLQFPDSNAPIEVLRKAASCLASCQDQGLSDFQGSLRVFPLRPKSPFACPPCFALCFGSSMIAGSVLQTTDTPLSPSPGTCCGKLIHPR